MPSADDIERVDHTGERTCCVLTVAGGRADRIYDLDIVISAASNCFGGVEEGLGLDSCLRYDERVTQFRQSGNFGFVTNDERVIRGVALYADHFRMVRAADD